MISDVAVLYVDPRGPYPRLVEHWYDEARDARTYAGPWPVVAHPPCGPWGRLARHCRGQFIDCGPRAVQQVQAYGGVLEHPAHSKLFDACGLRKPGEFPDEYGGFTIEVNQVGWGHKCLKPTWLYCVGVKTLGAMPPPREPTHAIFYGRFERSGAGPKRLVASKEIRRRTPVAFAEWLISLAQQVNRKGEVA